MGKAIGDYEVLAELARGGMGVVYRARERATGREVALKEVFHPDERFALEAEAIARLDHPGIVRVHAFDPSAQPPYLVMELIPGESLEARAKEGLALEEVLHLAPRLCEALAHAHARGVLHRDLKPANVLITPAGEPKLTDFGLGKVVDQSQHLTQTGEILGTPAFMPPEQAEGRVDRVGVAADVYGLGATLYAALTGGPPFRSRSMVEVLYAVLHKAPTPPSSLRPEVPAWLDAVILRCLEKDPAARYPDALALAEALASRAPPRSSARGKLLLGLLGVGCVLTLALALAWGRRPTPEPTAPTSPAPRPSASTATPTADVSPAAELEPAVWVHGTKHEVGVAFAGAGELWTLGGGWLRCWDLVGGPRERSAEQVATESWCLATSPAGELLVPLGQPGGLLRVAGEARETRWAELGPLARVEPGPRGWLALTSRETLQLALTSRETLHLVAPGGAPRRVDLEGIDGIESVAFHPDGTRLALVYDRVGRGEPKRLLEWDVPGARVLAEHAYPVSKDRRLRLAVYTAAGELLQAVSDGQYEYLDAQGRVTHVLRSHEEAAGGTLARSHWGSPRAIHQRGDRMVTVGAHNDFTRAEREAPSSLVVWDLELRRQVGETRLLQVDDPSGLDVSPDGRWAAVGGADGKVELVELPVAGPRPEPWQLPSASKAELVSVAFDGLGRLVTADRDAARMWDPWSRRELADEARSLPGSGDTRLAWGDAGGLVARRGRGVMLWLTPEGQVKPLEGEAARRVAGSIRGAVYAFERQEALWLLRLGRSPEPVALPGVLDDRGCLAFSPAGDRLLLTATLRLFDGSQDKRLLLIDTATGERVLDRRVIQRGCSGAFDGQAAFVGSAEGQLVVYDLRDVVAGESARWTDPERIQAWVDPQAPGLTPAAHPLQAVVAVACLGRRIYSLGRHAEDRSGELKAWSRDGQLLWREALDFAPGDLALALSDDGQWIAVGGKRGEALVLPTWGR